MVDLMWGMLGPDAIAGKRRTRALNLAAAVREFNERAIPGMGGVWFAKQIGLALLGIEAAKRARDAGKPLDNIRTANAVEAVACLIALGDGTGKADARVRGANKLDGQTDRSFARVSSPGFYVTQPMRMATVQALPALGLVETSGTRFNGFRLSNRGRDFIEAFVGDACYYTSTVFDVVVDWVQGKVSPWRYPLVCDALSPLKPMKIEALTILRNAIEQGGHGESNEGKERRRAALRWVERRRKDSTIESTWEKCPEEISSEHWQDLKSGASFFELRDAALHVLDHVEHTLGRSGLNGFKLDQATDHQSVKEAIAQLGERARRFLDLECNYDDAVKFARICAHQDPLAVVAELIKRDGRVLRLIGTSEVRPGSAYLGIQPWIDDPREDGQKNSVDGEEFSPDPVSVSWPEAISGRVKNLFLLNADMKGEIARWIGSATSVAGGS